MKRREFLATSGALAASPLLPFGFLEVAPLRMPGKFSVLMLIRAEKENQCCIKISKFVYVPGKKDFESEKKVALGLMSDATKISFEFVYILENAIALTHTMTVMDGYGCKENRLSNANSIEEWLLSNYSNETLADVMNTCSVVIARHINGFYYWIEKNGN